MGPRHLSRFPRTSLLSAAKDLAALAIWTQGTWPGNHVYSLEAHGPPEAWDTVGKRWDGNVRAVPREFRGWAARETSCMPVSGGWGADRCRNKLHSGPL